MKFKVDIRDIVMTINDLIDKDLKIVSDSNTSTDKFDTSLSEYIVLFTIGKLLIIRMHDGMLSQEEVENSIQKFNKLLFEEIEPNMREKAAKMLLPISQQIISWSKLTKSNFYSLESIQINSDESKHARSFRAGSSADIPSDNFVLKIKKKNGIDVHIRIGIDNTNDTLRIVNIIETKENDKVY